MTWRTAAAIGILFLPLALPAQAEEARLMRHPDIAGDRITFVYADKLWIAEASGANPRQLPAAGSELSRPRFSPDGRQIAFSASSDANTDVYVVAADGSGAARRLTHHPAADWVVDWDPAGAKVLFASSMASARPNFNQLHLVPAQGGAPTRLPLPYAETAAYSEDGTALLFTFKRDFQEEAWKRYYGGRAPDLWSYDFKTGATRRLTDSATSDSMPMQVRGQIYFLSERGASGRANIWRLDNSQGKAAPMTRFADSDVRRPATDGKRIIYEIDGQLEVLDPAAGTTAPVRIDIARADLAPAAKPEPVGERLTSAALTTEGGVIAEARGNIFAYDPGGETVSELTSGSSASAERFPRPNSRGDIAFISDRDGEYALYLRAAADGAVRRLADFGPGLRYNPFWSPDGRFIAIYDHQQVLWLIDATSGEKTRIDQGKWWYSSDLVNQRVSWSADSRWIAYARGLDNRNNALFLYDVSTRLAHQVTSGAFNDFAPVFDASGNYLLALSSRKFQPTFGDGNVDNTWTYAANTVVSLVPLNAATRAPGKPGWSAPERQSAPSIELSGLEDRLVVLEVKPGKLEALQPTPDGFVVLRQGEDPAAPNRIERYRLGKPEASELHAAKGLTIADADAQRLLTRAEAQLSVITYADGKVRALDGKKLVTTVDRSAEAQQMFADAWRYGRDFYYDPGLHGTDWNAARAKLGALLPYAVTDDDMTFLVRELVAELNGGHVYASATAPRPRGDAQGVGLLGADFEATEIGYRIVRIYRAGARAFEVRSPLDDAALGLREGDVIVSIDGKKLEGGVTPWEALAGLADKEVDLVIDSLGGAAPRTVRVKTLRSERKLRELAWVEENRSKVDKASGGRIGYIYVPNTGPEGITELMIQYRSQYTRDALIIDERFNLGGALGDRLVELLNRPPLVMFRARNSTDYPLPELAHRGPKAMLINGWSYSGGDGFPLLFKTARLGPLIGTRTWGGLIGPGMGLPLVNGGFISSPPQRVYGMDGKWSEGNEGVRPDIEIENDPGQLARGIDAQLDAAVAMLLKQIKRIKPVVVPPFYRGDDWNPALRGDK